VTSWRHERRAQIAGTATTGGFTGQPSVVRTAVSKDPPAASPSSGASLPDSDCGSRFAGTSATVTGRWLAPPCYRAAIRETSPIGQQLLGAFRPCFSARGFATCTALITGLSGLVPPPRPGKPACTARATAQDSSRFVRPPSEITYSFDESSKFTL
jgi:hypothetical protein